MLKSGNLSQWDRRGEIPTPASAEPIAGVINAELNKLFDEPIPLSGVINARSNIVNTGERTDFARNVDDVDADPENEMLDIGDLTGEIDSLSISEDAKSLIEPVQLDGEINATLVKLVLRANHHRRDHQCSHKLWHWCKHRSGWWRRRRGRTRCAGRRTTSTEYWRFRSTNARRATRSTGVQLESSRWVGGEP